MQFELAPFALPVDYAEDIVSLNAMKDHLAVLSNDQDDLIAAYRDAAVDMVERYCGVRLGQCEGLVWRGERLPSPARLGIWPVTAITAISWLNDAGVEVTGAVADWRIVRRDEIALLPGRSAPSGVAAGVEITFTAGFAADARPAALVQAVKMFAAHLFLHREAVITGTISGEIPLGFKMLCGAYRMPSI